VKYDDSYFRIVSKIIPNKIIANRKIEELRIENELKDELENEWQ